MGSTLVTAVTVAGWSTDDVVVVERDPVRAEALTQAHGVRTLDDVSEAVRDADIVVVAVKPQDAASVLELIGPNLTERAWVLSVAAGLPASFYEQRLPDGTAVVRCMPNTPAIVARGATAVAAGTHATVAHLAGAERILSATGLVVTVDESDLDAVTAVSGSGPAYFYAVVEALAEAGARLGLEPDLATRLAAQTLIGAAHLLAESGDTPQELRRRVSSPGGTTVAALETMAERNLTDVIGAGADAASRRSRELAADLDH